MVNPNKEGENKEIKVQFSHISIPLDILSNRSLATLESVVEYLKETHNLTFHQIAVLLNRDDRTIWTCYHRAQKKRTK